MAFYQPEIPDTHKIQGGEAPTIVLMLAPQHGAFLTREMLNTAITRARKNVLVYGSQEALERGLERSNADQCITVLSHLLSK